MHVSGIEVISAYNYRPEQSKFPKFKKSDFFETLLSKHPVVLLFKLTKLHNLKKLFEVFLVVWKLSGMY